MTATSPPPRFINTHTLLSHMAADRLILTLKQCEAGCLNQSINLCIPDKCRKWEWRSRVQTVTPAHRSWCRNNTRWADTIAVWNHSKCRASIPGSHPASSECCCGDASEEVRHGEQMGRFGAQFHLWAGLRCLSSSCCQSPLYWKKSAHFSYNRLEGGTNLDNCEEDGYKLLVPVIVLIEHRQTTQVSDQAQGWGVWRT